MTAALAVAGFSHEGWAFIASSRNRATFKSVELGVFAKVTDPHGVDRMVVEATFARWATKAAVAVVALAGEIADQPVIGEFGAATFWPLYKPVAVDEVDMVWLGRSLADLHGRRILPTLPKWDSKAWFRSTLADLRSNRLDSPLVRDLERQGERILATATRLSDSVPAVAVHGDAFPDNVVADGDRLLLIDFELAHVGPAALDLSPTIVLARRFGFPRSSSDILLETYGRTDPALLDAMVEVMELRVTCGAIGRYAGQHDVFRQELAVRVESLGDGGQARWTPHRLLLESLGGSGG
jgi:aminoglycoside phosphotransferase